MPDGESDPGPYERAQELDHDLEELEEELWRAMYDDDASRVEVIELTELRAQVIEFRRSLERFL